MFSFGGIFQIFGATVFFCVFVFFFAEKHCTASNLVQTFLLCRFPPVMSLLCTYLDLHDLVGPMHWGVSNDRAGAKVGAIPANSSLI